MRWENYGVGQPDMELDHFFVVFSSQLITLGEVSEFIDQLIDYITPCMERQVSEVEGSGFMLLAID